MGSVCRSFLRGVFLALAALPVSALASGLCYVNVAATGTNSGLNWANAFTSLQSALVQPGCTLVWVARGTYVPTAGTDRSVSFAVRPGLLLYGGFAGTEATIDDRFLAANETILSGDIGFIGDASDNSYHVVVVDGTTGLGKVDIGTAISDFTIRDGNADSDAAGLLRDRGGGLFCNGSGAGHECSPELDRVVFENNHALYGGAVYDLGDGGGKASPVFTDAVFRDNSASVYGGAMYNDGGFGTSSPTIERATFSGNSAPSGGGAIFDAALFGATSPVIRNATFYANVAEIGGAILNLSGGGGNASPSLRYVTFSGNRATNGAGGAIFNYATDGNAAPGISGAIFWGDVSTALPHEMATVSLTTPTLDNSISPECLPASIACTGSDPLLGALQDNDGPAPTLKPNPGSPAIDAGPAATCPAVDQRGVARPQGAQCDIGAVELRAAERQRCYVNKNVPIGVNNGQLWATAYFSLYAALINGNCQEVWVAKGSYFANNLLDAAAFGIAPGKALYGGFAGTETLLGQRNPVLNETILDGSLMYHTVLIDATGAATNVGGSTRLDGFTITGGNASAASGLDQLGGGLLCNGNTGFTCNPTLANLVFKNNGGVFGAGLFANGYAGMSSPSLRAVTFSGNHATTDGGGAYFVSSNGGAAAPVFEDVTFSGNNADNAGGGLLLVNVNGGVNRPVLRSSLFQNNTAKSGSALYSDGASVTFDGVMVRSNVSTAGGGAGAVYVTDASGAAFSRFSRTIFSGNTGSSGGGAYINQQAHPATSLTVFDRDTFDGNAVGQGPGNNGAGLYLNRGKTVVRDTQFTRNGPSVFGGGMLAVSADVTVDRSTFLGNDSDLNGAALYVQASTALVTNSTFLQNSTLEAAIDVISSTATLRNVTMTQNSSYSGAAALLVASGSAIVSDSILYGDSGTSGEIRVATNASATIDHSIIQNGCPGGATCTTVSSSDPQFGPLQKYGGYTLALMPLVGSPAIDAGANCAAADQRGVARPQGAACDIGSIERMTDEDHLFDNGFDF